MTALQWDRSGERFFQTGVDRGVLYLPDNAVVWNGLTSVEESSDQETKVAYLDGVKYLQVQTPGDYSGKLKAFTYPTEFELVTGAAESVLPGLVYHNQKPRPFGLSYRTRLGNDQSGIELGYKIHVLYNLTADPDAQSFETTDASIKPTEFSWTISGVPIDISGHRPTNHLTFDSTLLDPTALVLLEETLYGTDDTEPQLPSLIELLGYLGVLTIVDNGDGTWTVTDTRGTHITMLDSTTFQVDGVAATYDESGDEYTVHTTR